MESEHNEIRTIAWRELFPWTLIFRSLPVAVSIPVLLLALIGVLATPVGWKVCQWAMVNPEVIGKSDPLFAEFINEVGSPHVGIFGSTPGKSQGALFGLPVNGPAVVFHRFTEPFGRMFRQFSGLRPFLYLLLGGLWTIVVWSFIGVAITRIAILKYTRNEALDFNDALRFAWGQLPSCATALILPLIGVFLLCLLTFFAGLLMKFDLTLLVVSLFYFVVIALATVMAVILLGLAFGWPLTVAAISTEGQDSFDAMTRSYAYTFQRPLNYAFYALVAIVFGGLCWLVVAQVTGGIENLSYWSTSWGANLGDSDRIKSIRDISTIETNVAASAAASTSGALAAPTTSGLFRTSQSVLGFWIGLFKSVAVAFLYAQFWCMAAAIYLLLRRDVDETELDEVFVSQEQRTFELPPLTSPAGTVASDGRSARGEAETQVHRKDDGE